MAKHKFSHGNKSPYPENNLAKTAEYDCYSTITRCDSTTGLSFKPYRLPYLRRPQLRGQGFHLGFRVSAFPHDISARITKLDREMFQDESWKTINFEFNRSEVKSKKQCGRWYLHSCECWLLLVFVSDAYRQCSCEPY